jgi:type III pantothenate kinase
MHLVIDRGNTLCKVGIFDPQDQLVHVETVNELTVELLARLLTAWPVRAGILSAVRELDAPVLEWLEDRLPFFLRMTPETALPIGNAYATPHTLGLDRLAAAVGAWSLHPGSTLLVVDMGTAITYDLVDREGVFRGGNIAPGLRLRLQSLQQGTGRLPLVEPRPDFPFLGESTETAIRAGVMQGILLELQGYVRELQGVYPDLFAFLTGGDLIFFADRVKNGIFVHENLVLSGLNRILHHHVHP